MKLSIISFTQKGKILSERIAEEAEEMETLLFTRQKAYAGQKGGSAGRTAFTEKPVGEWAGEQMEKGHALLFIGACGIAVRAIAPHLKDKLRDSPVLVMDENGKYVIPILSGHVGGANALAVYLAEKTGAQAVITTATDMNRKFAVDLFAKKNGLFIVNKDGIAGVSAKALAGEEITLSIEKGHGIYGAEDDLQEKWKTVKPLRDFEGIRILPYPPREPVDVLITSEKGQFPAQLCLCPKEYVIGIGCKKGKEAKELEAFLRRKLKELGIETRQIWAAASVSQKKEEAGILAWCQKEKIPFWTYEAEELQAVEGDFQPSLFVKEQVGVDNVCERAAVKACGADGTLILKKCAEDGMTIAVAKRKWSVSFDEA
ncbi:MAG: cobalamin biosynthesis protein [Lachnospiraceae bacterium]|nr:cobalamin biosynthesis protein [Lachnospiraceae bacterium]